MLELYLLPFLHILFALCEITVQGSSLNVRWSDGCLLVGTEGNIYIFVIQTITICVLKCKRIEVRDFCTYILLC